MVTGPSIFQCTIFCVILSYALSMTSPIPPPPPISMPVWSLSCVSCSESSSKSSTSMNIMTFCMPVSINPKLWSLALYYDTMTKDSFFQAGEGVLQLLTPAHASLVPVLGKKSGYDVDKSQLCEEVGFPWKTHNFLEHQLLPNCALYLQVAMESSIGAGDHVVTICKITNTGKWNKEKEIVQWISPDDPPQSPLDEPEVLYSGWLRENGFL